MGELVLLLDALTPPYFGGLAVPSRCRANSTGRSQPVVELALMAGQKQVRETGGYQAVYSLRPLATGDPRDPRCKGND